MNNVELRDHANPHAESLWNFLRASSILSLYILIESREAYQCGIGEEWEFLSVDAKE